MRSPDRSPGGCCGTRHAGHVVCFDLLEHAGKALLARPCRERLESQRLLFVSGALAPPWTLVASTTDRAVALGWMDPAWGRAGMEGIVLRSGARPYRPGERELVKVRAYESDEAVIAEVTGSLHDPASLLLERYDRKGRLRLAARTTPLPAAARRDVAARLTPGGLEHPWNGRRFSAGWGTRGDLIFETVQPEVVVEFRADTAVDRGRYRHPVRFWRIRTDLDPADVAPHGEKGGSTPP